MYVSYFAVLCTIRLYVRRNPNFVLCYGNTGDTSDDDDDKAGSRPVEFKGVDNLAKYHKQSKRKMKMARPKNLDD